MFALHKFLVVLLTLSLVHAAAISWAQAYRNLDVIPFPWTINDYLTMNAGQKELVQRPPSRPPGLALHHAICLATWTANRPAADGRQQPGPPTPRCKPVLSKPNRQLAEMAREIPHQQCNCCPKAWTIIRVKDMSDAPGQGPAQTPDEYLKPPLPQQIKDRAERMSTRLDALLGPLSPGQQIE